MRRARAVGDYFYEGPLTETWAFSDIPAEVRDRYQPFTITYARRTMAGWVNAVLGAGLVIEAIAEPYADEETAATHPQVADTRIALTSSSCAPGSRKIQPPPRLNVRPAAEERTRVSIAAVILNLWLMLVMTLSKQS